MSVAAPLRVLVLGGSSEASMLVSALHDRPGILTVLSLAGRTSSPMTQPVSTRVGGFGGAAGLTAYLRDERIDLLVDATHPFAEQMSRHARQAAAVTGCRLIAITRPAWAPEVGDDWREVPDMPAAAEALGRVPRRVFLTIGRQQFGVFARAPQHTYLVRTIDPIDASVLPHVRTIQERGPFDADAEERLMTEHRIDILVTKNSGGAAARGKLEAARRLKLPVILVRRPSLEQGVDVDAALAAIEAHHATADRGV